MADLFQGQTMTAAAKFISFGTAHTFNFSEICGFQPDMVRFNNLTQWGVAGQFPVSTWFRTQTAAAQAYQQRVIVDNGVTGNQNFVDTLANGFTVADIASGTPSFRALISNITQANPCVVTTTAPHGFQTNQIARFTDLGSDMPVPRGMDQLDGNRYGIVVLSPTTFSLYDVISGDPVDSTLFTAYVSGGRVVIETRVLTLNNPEQPPYNVTPYVPNPYEFNPETYQLLVGSAVMGALGDEFLMEIYKWGQFVDLGTFTS
jgi:hypothetical protein